MQKLPEDSYRKGATPAQKEGTLSAKERSLFSFSRDQRSDDA